jgi:hypothetical protein
MIFSIAHPVGQCCDISLGFGCSYCGASGADGRRYDAYRNPQDMEEKLLHIGRTSCQYLEVGC